MVTVLPKLQYWRATSSCWRWTVGAVGQGMWLPQSSEQLAVDRHLCSLRVPCDRERRGGSGRTLLVLEVGHVDAGLHTPFIYPNPSHLHSGSSARAQRININKKKRLRSEGRKSVADYPLRRLFDNIIVFMSESRRVQAAHPALQVGVS